MKVAAVLDCEITSGGGFNQSLNAIEQMARLCRPRYEFEVFTSKIANLKHLDRIGVSASLFSFSLTDRWLAYSATVPLWRRIQADLHLRGELEKKLEKHGVDLVYFPEPTSRCLALQKLNYIATVWDLCHRDNPEFPEVREYNQFLSRERIYENTLSQALSVITDSDTLSDRLASRYGVDSERVIAMPFAPASSVTASNARPMEEVLQLHGLEAGYFFYPAQFWPHKNHIRILQALAVLNERGVEISVVFCGTDRGSEKHVMQETSRLGLDGHVRFLGFVAPEDMRGLYEACCAVVMPSYFGPTNLPPLEAWTLDKALIYSSSFAGEAGDAALLVNPDSESELADAMESVLKPEVSEALVLRGREHLAAVSHKRVQAEKRLHTVLDRLAARLECWKH